MVKMLKGILLPEGVINVNLCIEWPKLNAETYTIYFDGANENTVFKQAAKKNTK